MSRLTVTSVVLLAADLIFLLWFGAAHPRSAGILFLATLVAVALSALVQRLRFGRDRSWRTRLHPFVVTAFIVGFDLVFLGLPTLARFNTKG